MLQDWKKIYSSKNGIKAELLKNELLTHEVHAVVMNKQESIYHLFGEYEVYVPDNEELIAKTIVDIFNQNDQETQ